MKNSLFTVQTADLTHKRVLIRMDLNVPLGKGGEVTDDTRIRAAIPTIQYILAKGGCCVVMSHLGRPRGKVDPRYSLKHIIPVVRSLLGKDIQFAPCCIDEEAVAKAANLKPGDVLLLENLRFHKEEEGGSIQFAEKLARLGDVYVNDAFGVAHRNHASVAIVPRFFKKKYFGKIMFRELEQAKKLLNDGKRPFIAVVGGAKISDKIVLLERLLEKVDQIIVGGGMAYTFCRALGGDVGSSLMEKDKLDTAKALIEKAKEKGVSLLLPEDSVVGDNIHAEAHTMVADSFHIAPGWMGLDIGPQARKKFSAAILAGRSILWNGPMGIFELKKFEEGTRSIGEAVAKATDLGAFSLVGGGDSVAAAVRFGLRERVSHLSTGGGALLAYFEGNPLPAIEAFNSEPLY